MVQAGRMVLIPWSQDAGAGMRNTLTAATTPRVRCARTLVAHHDMVSLLDFRVVPTVALRAQIMTAIVRPSLCSYLLRLVAFLQKWAEKHSISPSVYSNAARTAVADSYGQDDVVQTV